MSTQSREKLRPKGEGRARGGGGERMRRYVKLREGARIIEGRPTGLGWVAK